MLTCTHMVCGLPGHGRLRQTPERRSTIRAVCGFCGLICGPDKHFLMFFAEFSNRFLLALSGSHIRMTQSKCLGIYLTFNVVLMLFVVLMLLEQEHSLHVFFSNLSFSRFTAFLRCSEARWGLLIENEAS